MIVANFVTGYDEITASKLTQWDYGQQLHIYGLADLPEMIEVHFCDRSCEKTIVRIGNKVDEHYEVAIPDRLLENEFSINAFIYLKDTSCGETVKTIRIPVVARKQPENYVDPDDPTVDDKLTQLIADVAELSTKFARVFGLNDEQLDIKICESEPAEPDENVLYVFPDDEYSDLNTRIATLEHALDDGSFVVGSAAGAATAESADYAKTTLITKGVVSTVSLGTAGKINPSSTYMVGLLIGSGQWLNFGVITPVRIQNTDDDIVMGTNFDSEGRRIQLLMSSTGAFYLMIDGTFVSSGNYTIYYTRIG